MYLSGSFPVLIYLSCHYVVIKLARPSPSAVAMEVQREMRACRHGLKLVEGLVGVRCLVHNTVAELFLLYYVRNAVRTRTHITNFSHTPDPATRPYLIFTTIAPEASPKP